MFSGKLSVSLCIRPDSYSIVLGSHPSPLAGVRSSNSADTPAMYPTHIAPIPIAIPVFLCQLGGSFHHPPAGDQIFGVGKLLHANKKKGRRPSVRRPREVGLSDSHTYSQPVTGTPPPDVFVVGPTRHAADRIMAALPTWVGDVVVGRAVSWVPWIAGCLVHPATRAPKP